MVRPPRASTAAGGASWLDRHRLETDPETSVRLARVRQHGTSAELIVRRALHAAGHRFRTVNRDLPGRPDIANRARQWAVFVHGCFWHRHHGCERATLPKRNRAFWAKKFSENERRDRRVIAALRKRGYRVFVVWECEAESRATMRRVVTGLEGR